MTDAATDTVPTTLLRPLLAMGEALGLPRSRLREVVGADEARLASADARLPYDVLRRVWELLVAERGGTEPLGLRLAEHTELTHLGLVGYVLVNSPDLRTALQRHCRVMALLDPRTAWRLTDTPGGLRGEMGIDAWGRALGHPAEGLLATLTRAGRMLSGVAWVPRRLALAHAPHATSARVEAFFGCPVTYGASAYAMEVDAGVLALPVAHADVGLGNLLHARAEAALAEARAGERAWAERVREALEAQPRLGERGPAEVARRLAVSERTLQRRLGGEGVTFAQLEDAVRRERGLALVRDAQLSLFEVAFLLGFSDASAFSRAFKRWTGMAPVAWQRGQRGPG